MPDVATVTSLTSHPFAPEVPLVTASATPVGAVLSNWTVNAEALVLRPASFVQDPLNVAPAVSVVWCWSAVQVTGLLIESLPEVETVTSLV